MRTRLLLPMALLAGCAGEPLPVGGGIQLPEARPRPDFTLTTTRGERFDFFEETQGRTTLLFFGYTSCPDVCPVQMAGLGAALRGLPPDRARELVTVFVTTDPARDSAEILRRWLDGFNREFIGLRGSDAEVAAAEDAAGVPPASTGPVRADGSYLVGHAAYVLAIGTDDSVRTAFPFGTRQADWDLALRQLLGADAPPPPPTALSPGYAGAGFATAPSDGGMVVAYPVIRNPAARPDTLVGATSPVADTVLLHESQQVGGRLVMSPIHQLIIPPGEDFMFAPGGHHLMLEGLRDTLRPGDTVELELTFRLQGRRVLRLPVRSYADVARE